MSSLKITNVLLTILVLLLAVHVALEVLRPVGRYYWVNELEGSSFTVFDTSTGIVYTSGPDKGMTLNIPRHATHYRDASAFTESK